MKKKKKGKLVINIISALCLFLSLYIVLASVISNNQYGVPIVFNHSFLVVQTGSMETTINVNDLVISAYVDFESIVEEDIIVFINVEEGSIVYGQPITHRVKEINRDENNQPISFRTKGDNNPGYDRELVTKENFRGKVITISSAVGAFFASLTNGTGMIFIMIFILLAAIVLLEIKNIQQIRLEAKKEKFLIEKEKLKQQLLDEYNAQNKSDEES